MINFIIVDDNYSWLEQVSSIIDKVMVKTNFDYSKKTFSEYDKDFYAYIGKELQNEVYILDIRTNENNGVDIAREIRRKNSDAIIIFLTAYEEYGNKILKSMLEVFCLISKKDSVEDILEQNIMEILKRIKLRKDTITIKDNTNFYSIPLSKLLYITMDTKKRKAVIVTDLKTIYCKKTLRYFEQKYGNCLIKTHKSCLVNSLRAIDYDFKNQRVYFNNNIHVDLLSTKYKKQIEKRKCVR